MFNPAHSGMGRVIVRKFQVMAVRARLIGVLLALTISAHALQISTEERLQQPGWWPRKPTPSRGEYAGPQACAQCHTDLADTQQKSAMALTSTVAGRSFALQSSEKRQFAIGPFHYQLRRQGDNFGYQLSAAGQSIAEPLGWSFGTEKIGQTYVFEKSGTFHESVFSYFESLQGFARTPGIDLVPLPFSVPGSLRKGAGRPLLERTAQGCFTCHNTAAMTDGKLDPAHLIPSVTCEACHGPGAQHVAAENAVQDGAEKLIFSPHNLSPADSVEFCGSCHRTWWDVMLTEEVGVSTVLAVPYRLQKSQCWGKGDSRITCVACHDPHRPLVRDAASYDQRCLSCHAAKGAPPAGDHPGKACSVAVKECVTCHMPKYEVEDMQYHFTDHMIRIVKAGESFPN